MNTDPEENKPKVRWCEITSENCDQRLDNFLITFLKGVPKTRIYRIIRKGEVRVNKGRVNNKYRLKEGDIVRIPPVRVAIREKEIDLQPTLKKHLEQDIIFEDEVLIVLNKPSGFAVHGGSGISSGVIEALRALRPDDRFLELAHRIDKDTSGCLLVAKKRSALKNLHEQFRGVGIKKTYWALLVGEWGRKKQRINAPLLKNTGKGGERVVKVSQTGKSAETHFRRLQKYKELTLVEASPITGRTHQIRVHAAWMGHPIVADERYGADGLNKNLKKKGYNRLFLHAKQLQFNHPVTNEVMCFDAPLPQTLEDLLKKEALLNER